MKIFSEDLQKATSTSLPITLILLVLAFGTLVAAGIPLLLAITGVLGTMGVVAALSQLSPVEETINHVILLIGLAVGVDYALFYLRRVREERAAGRRQGSSHRGGRGHLGTRSARLRLHGHDRHGRDVFRRSADVHASFATGTIVVVAVAMLGSLTVLPALLSMLGDRTEKGRIPGLGRLRTRVAVWASGRGSWTASSAVPCCRPSWPRACSWRWRSRRSGWTSAPRTPRPRCRRTSRWCRRSITSRRRSRPRPRP